MRRSASRLTGALLVLAMAAPLACLLLYSLADRFSPTAALPPAYSLRWYALFARDPAAVGALLTSLAVASASTAIALAVGLPAGWALARRVPGAGLVEGVVLLRGAVPVIVLGLGTAAVLYRLHAVDRWPSLILAHAVGGLPFVVWLARPAFAALDPDLDAAARDLGAGLGRRLGLALRGVTPALVAAALLAFLFSVDEFAVTFLISGQRIVTLPVLLYGALETDSVQAAAAVAVVMLLPSAVVAAAGAWALTRFEEVTGLGWTR